MTKRNQHAKVYRGDTAAIVVAVIQADGTPYDPTIGAVLKYRMALTSHAPDYEALVRKTSANASEITDDGLGNVTVVLNPEDTDHPPGVYYHELKVWDGADVATAMVGNFIIKKAIPMGDMPNSPQGNLAIDKKTPIRTP